LYASNILKGLVPYKDFLVEYPPGVLPFILLPRLVASDEVTYRLFYMLGIILIDLLGLFLLGYYVRKHGFSQRFRFAVNMIYTALPAIIMLVAYQRMDFILAVLVLTSVILLDSGRRMAAWSVLGLGVAVKLFPVVLAPVYLISAYRQKMLKKDILFGIPAAIATVAVVWIPFIMVAGQNFFVFLKYHGQRGIQAESFYSTFLFVAYKMGYQIKTRFSFGSWNIESSLSPVLAGGSFLVMVILLVYVLLHCFRISQNEDWDLGDIPRMAALMILAFIIGGKVLSPQFLLWCMPLVIICLKEDYPVRITVWTVTGLIFVMSYCIFPLLYKALIVDFNTCAIIVLVVRNCLLMYLFYLLLRAGNVYNKDRKISDT
jgi:uncharacterized membrane protein